MKVLFLTKYSRMGASSRLRSMQYVPLLKSKGFQVTVQSLFDDIYLANLYSDGRRSKLAMANYYLKRLYTLLKVRQYDIVWIEKEIFPYLPALVEQLLPLVGIKYIVDYDDAIFHSYDLSKSKFISFFLGKKIDKVMKNASCVIVGNNYLADRAVVAGARNVKLIPTVVNHNRYQQRQSLKNDVLTIGWIGSPFTQKYVVEILSELQEAYGQHPFRLLLIGAASDVHKLLPGLDVDVRDWSEDTEVGLIGLMDIGIMPLIDNPWEKGKCGYKLIQYMACGVPVIASDVGVNKVIINDQQAGFVVNTKEDWLNVLLQLLRSSSLRHIKGTAGRDIVKQQYSIDSQAKNIIDVLNMV